MTGGPAVVGIADHRGWAILVCVAECSGVPVLVDRRRVELVGADVPSQPYHHEAADLELAEAEKLVRRVERSVASHARAALSKLRDELEPKHRLVALTLREEPAVRVPETIAAVLDSHAATIKADGTMYRAAIRNAAAELEIEVAPHPRATEIEGAARALGVDATRVQTFLRDLGRGLGPPWRKEHRNAAAAAVSDLAQRVPLGL